MTHDELLIQQVGAAISGASVGYIFAQLEPVLIAVVRSVLARSQD